MVLIIQAGRGPITPAIQLLAVFASPRPSPPRVNAFIHSLPSLYASGYGIQVLGGGAILRDLRKKYGGWKGGGGLAGEILELKRHCQSSCVGCFCGPRMWVG